MNKPEMRAAMNAFLRGIPRDERAAGSARVAQRLAATDPWKAADLLLCFLSMPGELDTEPMIRAARAAGLPVAVPRIEGGEIRFVLMPEDPGTLARDTWGIPTPDSGWPGAETGSAKHPLAVVPGLAFDRAGNRLGRGKGYYDRFLVRARRGGPGLAAIGVCLAGQLVAEVPHSALDQRVDGVVTDAETLLWHNARA